MSDRLIEIEHRLDVTEDAVYSFMVAADRLRSWVAGGDRG
jgi:hypothetical protein